MLTKYIEILEFAHLSTFLKFCGGTNTWLVHLRYLRMLNILFFEIWAYASIYLHWLIAELFLTAIVHLYITQEPFFRLFLLHYEPSIFMFWERYLPIFNCFVFFIDRSTWSGFSFLEFPLDALLHCSTLLLSNYALTNFIFIEIK